MEQHCGRARCSGLTALLPPAATRGDLTVARCAFSTYGPLDEQVCSDNQRRFTDGQATRCCVMAALALMGAKLLTRGLVLLLWQGDSLSLVVAS